MKQNLRESIGNYRIKYWTSYNFFTKPTLSILHQAIELIVNFELFLVSCYWFYF